MPRVNYDELGAWAGAPGGGGGQRRALNPEELAALREDLRHTGSPGGRGSRGAQDSGKGVRVQVPYIVNRCVRLQPSCG